MLGSERPATPLSPAFYGPCSVFVRMLGKGGRRLLELLSLRSGQSLKF